MLTALHATLTGMPIGDLYQIGLTLAIIPAVIGATLMLQKGKAPYSVAPEARATSTITD